MAKKKMTIEDLAVMVKKGFDQTATQGEVQELRKEALEFRKEVDERFDRVNRQIGELTEVLMKFIKATEDNFRHVNARLDRVRDDVSDLPTMREEMRTFRARLERLERKVGSGR